MLIFAFERCISKKACTYTLILPILYYCIIFPFLYIKPSISNDLLQDNHESECFLGHHESLPYLIFVLSAILTILVFTYVAYGRICYKAMRSQRHAKNNVQRCKVSLNLKKVQFRMLHCFVSDGFGHLNPGFWVLEVPLEKWDQGKLNKAFIHFLQKKFAIYLMIFQSGVHSNCSETLKTH